MNKFYMPFCTLALGLVLNAIGLLSYSITDSQSWTPLIPAFLGGLFLVAFGMSFAPKLRPHAMHGAVALALLLSLYGLYKVGDFLARNDALPVEDRPTALQMFAFETMTVACLAYVTLGVRSFVLARKARKQAAADIDRPSL